MRLGRLLLRSVLKSRGRKRPPLPHAPITGRKVVKRKSVAPKTSLERLPSVRANAPVQKAHAESDPAHLRVSDLLRPSVPLKESIEGFLLDQRSGHTRLAYGKDIKRLLKFLLVLVAQDKRNADKPVQRSLLVAYKESLLTENLQHTTIDRHLASLRSFFGWLSDEGWIASNPAEGVRFLNPKKLSKTVGFVDEEVKKILSLPDLNTRTGSLHYAVLTALFYCGLRRSELCLLRTSQISKERGFPVVRLQGKGNAERIIVLVPPVWNALQHYFRITRKDMNEDQFLFTPFRNNRTGAHGKPLDPSMIFYIVRRYAKLAGIANRVSPHSCRATAISNARDRHVPDRAIQEFAGWASPDMITRYDKRRTSVEKSAAHAIAYGAPDRTLEE